MSTPRFSYSRHRHATPGAAVPALECSHVSVTYPRAERPAVHDVSLVVPQGARVALVGANGAGKSTLLKAAAGLIPVSAGAIRVHGSPPRGCCHRVAYLAQRGDLDWKFPMTVRRLVLTGRYVHLGWLARPGEKDHAIVDRVMQLLQIDDLAERRIGELSGGQQQRTLLARAMAQEADTLLLDEPMNGIDAATRMIIRQVLRKLSDEGKTIVAATHDMHEIEVDFDTVIHLSCGCKEDPGSIEDVEIVHDHPHVHATAVPAEPAIAAEPSPVEAGA